MPKPKSRRHLPAWQPADHSASSTSIAASAAARDWHRIAWRRQTVADGKACRWLPPGVIPRLPHLSPPARRLVPCAGCPGSPPPAPRGPPAAAWSIRGAWPPTAAGPHPRGCRTPAQESGESITRCEMTLGIKPASWGWEYLGYVAAHRCRSAPPRGMQKRLHRDVLH